MSGKGLKECMLDYLDLSMTIPVFGATFFEVSMVRDDVSQPYILGINSEGLHVIDRATRALIVSFSYVYIMRWSRYVLLASQCLPLPAGPTNVSCLQVPLKVQLHYTRGQQLDNAHKSGRGNQ